MLHLVREAREYIVLFLWVRCPPLARIGGQIVRKGLPSLVIVIVYIARRLHKALVLLLRIISPLRLPRLWRLRITPTICLLLRIVSTVWLLLRIVSFILLLLLLRIIWIVFTHVSGLKSIESLALIRYH